MSKRAFYPAMVIVLGVLLAVTMTGVRAAQDSKTVRVGNADIGGVVTSAKGPEAGGWGVGASPHPPPKHVNIVVPGQHSGLLVARHPAANHKDWVRGRWVVE